MILIQNCQMLQVAYRRAQSSGLCCFFIYINDLPNLLPGIECYGFADNFKVVLENYERLDCAFNQIKEWRKTKKHET